MKNITLLFLVLLPILINNTQMQLLNSGLQQQLYTINQQPLRNTFNMDPKYFTFQDLDVQTISVPKLQQNQILRAPSTLSTIKIDPSFFSIPTLNTQTLSWSAPSLTTQQPQFQTTTQYPTISSSLVTTSNTESHITNFNCPTNQIPNHLNTICMKPSYIQGCQVYETSTSCHKCSLEYKLVGTEQKICDYQEGAHYNSGETNYEHILGCIKRAQLNKKQCEICAEGFYKKQGKCQHGIKYCLSYDQEGACLECEPQYSLILSECRHNTLLGCKYQTPSHTCQECYPPFQKVSQHCDIPNCRSLNDYGCVACECGYYLTQSRTCHEISPGCLRYQKGVCKDCLPHYRLKGGVCQIQGCLEYEGNYCRKCGEKYDLNKGQCHFKNCFDWINDQCQVCKEGYAIRNGICERVNQVICE